jgi:hypothetical protein
MAKYYALALSLAYPAGAVASQLGITVLGL